jgi:hypothetical protein
LVFPILGIPKKIYSKSGILFDAQKPALNHHIFAPITTQKPQFHHHKTTTFPPTPLRKPAKTQKVAPHPTTKKIAKTKLNPNLPDADRVHYAAGTNPGSR